MDTEELLAQMEADELEDRVAEQTKATPIDYARSRGIAPQKVYYRIRRGQLETERCACGRRVVDIATADAIFRKVEPDDSDGTDSL
jgi:hypothetical protein